MRYQTIHSAAEFRRRLIEKSPDKIDIGAVYTLPVRVAWLWFGCGRLHVPTVLTQQLRAGKRAHDSKEGSLPHCGEGAGV